MIVDDAQHFVRDPEWTWYILFYFFFAGLSGGSYVIASLMRLNRSPDYESTARLGYYVSFAALLPCPVLLTLDLGKPLRFWHMLVNTTPGDVGLSFKYWSPMSVGAWALVVFGAFVTGSFLETFVRDRGISRGLIHWVVRPLAGPLGMAWTLVGGLLGLFVAGYTGVLLAVSNQPVWSDTWALGGLFLASGLSGSAALLLWLSRHRRGAERGHPGLVRSERVFQVLELVLLVAFVLTLIPAGTFDEAFGFPWMLLWLVALVGLVQGLGGPVVSRRTVAADGAVAVDTARVSALLPAAVILAGVLALRAAVIFSAQ